MPSYQRFEDLPVWQTAAALYERGDDFLDAAPPRLRNSFRDQLERAIVSVSNNIAEGFERGTTSELLYFLYVSRGSAGEVRSMLALLIRRPWMTKFKSQLTALIELAESCSRQTRAWADTLQNSDISGQRHLNEQSRATYQKKQARRQGEQRLHELQRAQIENLPPEHPLRRQWEQQHGRSE